MNEEEIPGLEYWPEMPGARKFQYRDEKTEWAEAREKAEALMGEPRIYADLNGRIRNSIELTGMGTRRDLRRYGMVLAEGAFVLFWTDSGDENDPLLFEGYVHFDSVKMHWIALVDWENVRDFSDGRRTTTPV